MKWLASSTGQATFEDIKNTSLGKLVRDQLLSGILSGAYAPGQALRESELVEQLKVSRVPVREALRELESSGLVVSRKHSGVYVRELSDEEVRDLYQFRALLDSHAGRMAAQLPDDEREELVRELDNCVSAMDAAIREGNAQGYYSLNLEFHWLFIEYAGNREIAKAYREIIQKLHLARLKNLSTEAHRLRSNAEHREIVDALRKVTSSGQAAEYAELLARHVINAHDRLSVL
ncbi:MULTISPECIES: GntR family transcriptional regulator [unclassified Achromobacter]|uniref:GntR family transcriptional regulator n=1 Tax=unclassified Achromobacter TaxID=2626865 RepID=UPI00069E2DC8|nr:MULTISPECIES: GntR family transcriptional regulator [unclassified Achromobacter]KOF53802.1 GntR family transcriptional regulator [Achromobacter sp. DMS1]KOF55014.1 GntR family transcriptional regulator [Achromobacter sp. DMS1]